MEPYWEPYWEGAAGGLGELVWRGERLRQAWTSVPEGLGGTGRNWEGTGRGWEGLWGCMGLGWGGVLYWGELGGNWAVLGGNWAVLGG